MNVWISNTTAEQEPVLTWNRPSDVTVQMVTDLVSHLKCLLAMVVFQNTFFVLFLAHVELRYFCNNNSVFPLGLENLEKLENIFQSGKSLGISNKCYF